MSLPAPATNTLQVITVVNFKGGSGKTTTAAHLAQYLALAGLSRAGDRSRSAGEPVGAARRSSPNSTSARTRRSMERSATTDQRRDLKDIIRKTYFANLDLVPANLELMEFEHETPKALLERSRPRDMFFTRMDEALATVADDYDVVVVDCPPQLGFLTMSALCSATAVLVTVHPQMLDVMSMCQFLIMTSDLLARRRRRRRQHGLRLDALSRHPLRAGRRAAEPDGLVHAVDVRRPRAELSDAQEHGDFRRRHHQADALRSHAAISSPAPPTTARSRRSTTSTARSSS